MVNYSCFGSKRDDFVVFFKKNLSIYKNFII